MDGYCLRWAGKHRSIQMSLLQKKRGEREWHPKTVSLERKVFFVLNDSNQLVTHVYFSYRTNIPVVPIISLRKRKLFSAQSEIKEALRNRTKAEAKAYLRDNGIDVTTYELTSACRTVSSHKKTKLGRKPATDPSKLYNMFACSSNHLQKLEPLLVDKVGEKATIVQVVTFPVAFKHFAAHLPDFHKLLEHKKKIELMSQMNEMESDEELRRMLAQVNCSAVTFASDIDIK
ncbi:unnamed protein product [Auanema sp. JU1783]|nr:unnamed protein product [Auanema sp. JU1783]